MIPARASCPTAGSGGPAPAALAGLVPSNKEGRRKIEQGGVRLDGERVTDADRCERRPPGASVATDRAACGSAGGR